MLPVVVVSGLSVIVKIEGSQCDTTRHRLFENFRRYWIAVALIIRGRPTLTEMSLAADFIQDPRPLVPVTEAS